MSNPGKSNAAKGSGIVNTDQKNKSPAPQNDEFVTKKNLRDVIREEFKKVSLPLREELQQVRDEIADLKKLMGADIGKLSKRIESVESRVLSLELMSSDIDNLKAKIKDMEVDQRRNDQWVRRSNIQIDNVPQKKDENLINLIKVLATRSGFNLNPDTDIDFVTRIAVKNDTDQKKIKPIILKMQSRYKKDEFISSLRSLKNLKASDIGFAGDDSRVFINDHLSTYNKYLLKQARTRKDERNYKYCWVRNCTIMVRRDDTSPILHITSEEALNKIK
ncbi:hypothetical protein O0L34_g5140 [Tuta absoluta]|nr:hypothetical protein O0L34_g18429 [Tuta absoluta]KAJ2946205.1 hypothetical protein O0L34_g5140 [Tuta absoluta]